MFFLLFLYLFFFFFFSSRRRHTRSLRDWSSDVCSSDLGPSHSRISTMVMGGGSPAATLISGNAAGRGFTGEDQTVIATARSLNARASAPSQTPLVRRTGAIARAPEPPKKKNALGTFFAALLPLGVIVYGAYRIKPVFEAARELHDEQKKGSSLPATATPAPAASEPTSDNST